MNRQENHLKIMLRRNLYLHHSTLLRDKNPSEPNSRGSSPSIVEPTLLPYKFCFGEELPEELRQKLLEGQQVLSSNLWHLRRHLELHSAQPKGVDLKALLNFYTQHQENMSTKQMPLPNSKDAPKVLSKEVAFCWWNKGKLVGLECRAKGGMECVEFGRIQSSMDTCNS